MAIFQSRPLLCEIVKYRCVFFSPGDHIVAGNCRLSRCLRAVWWDDSRHNNHFRGNRWFVVTYESRDCSVRSLLLWWVRFVLWPSRYGVRGWGLHGMEIAKIVLFTQRADRKLSVKKNRNLTVYFMTSSMFTPSSPHVTRLFLFKIWQVYSWHLSRDTYFYLYWSL